MLKPVCNSILFKYYNMVYGKAINVYMLYIIYIYTVHRALCYVISVMHYISHAMFNGFTLQMVNFEFTDVARVLEIPGLHELLQTALMTQLANHLILPKKITVSLCSTVDVAQLRYIEPKVCLANPC